MASQPDDPERPWRPGQWRLEEAGEAFAGWSAVPGAMGRFTGEAFGRPMKLGATDRGSTLSTALRPPLDLGLHLFPQGILADTLDEAFGPQDVTVGDSSFDPMVRVAGDDPDRVRALLVPPVRAAVLGLLRLGTDFRVTDAGVEVSGLGDPDWLSQAARVLADAAWGLEEARAAVPAASPLRAAAAAADALASRGLQVTRTPFRAAGVVDEMQVAIEGARRRRDHFEVTVSVVPEERLGLGLRVHRRTGLTSLVHAASALFGAADRAFDARFAVEADLRGRPGLDLRALVDDKARAHVLAIAAASAGVTVDDGAVHAVLGFAPGRTDDLAAAVDEAVALARRLADNLRRLTSAASGPYR